jgi:arginase family enzyme
VQSYGFITALTRKHGPKQFALLHVDAHNDTYLYDYGRAVHNGSLFTAGRPRSAIAVTDGRSLSRLPSRPAHRLGQTPHLHR